VPARLRTAVSAHTAVAAHTAGSEDTAVRPRPARLAGACLSTVLLAAVSAVAFAAPAEAATGSSQQSSAPKATLTAGQRALLGGTLHLNGQPVAGDEVRFYRLGAGGERSLLGAASTDSHGGWDWRTTVDHSEAIQAVTAAKDGAASVRLRADVTAVQTETLGERAVADAARLAGDPYEYGADGPNAFDCSGLTRYVYGELGISLPHNAAAQYDDVTHIPASQMRPGDLIFFADSGGIYHVGIYAGDDSIWHAPHSGTSVQRDQLWTSDFLVGRVR
jgi:cell wall-associated NlpC family hydrolase